MIARNWKLRLPPGHFELVNKTKKGFIGQGDYREEIRLLPYNEDEEEDVWNTGEPPGCHLVRPYPVIKVSAKPQHAH